MATAAAASRGDRIFAGRPPVIGTELKSDERQNGAGRCRPHIAGHSQMMCAASWARATVATFVGRRGGTRWDHAGGALLLVNSERAPWISKVRRKVCPRLELNRRLSIIIESMRVGPV